MSDEDWDRSLDDHDYVALVFSYLTFVTVAFITVVFVRRLPKSNDEQQASDETILTKWIAIDQEHGILLNTNLYGVAMTPYTCNLMGLLPFIILQRLNHLLQSNYIHIFSYAALSFGIVFMPIVIIISNMVGPSDAFSAITVSFMLISIIIYFVVAFLYLRQILRVMKARMENNMRIKHAELSSANVNHTRNTTEDTTVIVSVQTVKDTVRCALLIMICSVSNLLAPVMELIGQRTAARHVTHQTTFIAFGTFTDTICNTLCIFLFFRFADKYYVRMCKPCNECALDCCMKNVMKGARKKKNTKLTDEQYVSLILED
eukprot:269246_1